MRFTAALLVLVALIAAASALQCYVGQTQPGFDSKTPQDCPPPAVCLKINAGGATQYQCNSCPNQAGTTCCSTDLCNNAKVSAPALAFVVISALVAFLF